MCLYKKCAIKNYFLVAIVTAGLYNLEKVLFLWLDRRAFMEAMMDYIPKENTGIEIRKFVMEGMQDVYQNRLLDLDAVFDELACRYHADD